jgi:predicted GNAT superfamily acetyltransferase
VTGLDYPPAIRILERPEEIEAVEELQRQVWPGSETDIVPLHLLVTAARHGGLLLGAFDGDRLVGFVFGFAGLDFLPEGPRPRHCSHMMGVHPEYRNQGVGFSLKRAQWQMVRHQGLELITWTYDPLLGQNANLNIAKLGAVCNQYLREVYGEMRDGLNAGLSSDRFLVQLWVNSPRVKHRMGKRPRRQLDLAHYYQAGAKVINPTSLDGRGMPQPPSADAVLQPIEASQAEAPLLLLLEIPADFYTLRTEDPGLAREWRRHSRALFERLLLLGYLVTDFIYLPGATPRSFYVLSHGESTLGA